MQFWYTTGCAALAAAWLWLGAAANGLAGQPQPQPNILWLDAEDANVNWIGCYGNPAATTPNIDRLAGEGFRYTRAFANAPVCAPSRSTWITGVLALSMGTHPMRSRYHIPHEELYDTDRDPDNVINLAGRPEHQEDLEAMRAELRNWQLTTYDAGMIPEEMMTRRAAEHGTTIYEMVRDPDLYDLPGYLDAADLALEADPTNADSLIELLESDDPGMRYWGAAGMLMLEELSGRAVEALKSRLDDASHEVRAMAAWGLIDAGEEQEAARACLTALLEEGSYASLRVLNIIDHLNEDPAVYRSAVKAAQGPGYVQRMKEYLLEVKR